MNSYSCQDGIDVCDGSDRICKECGQFDPGMKIQFKKNLCNVCDNKQFRNKWSNSTPAEKLILHGIAKLKILANKKNINCEDMNKEEIIEILKPIVTADDFPIK